MQMKKHMLVLASIASLALSMGAASQAEAAFLITLTQVGNDLSENSSGAFDLTDLKVFGNANPGFSPVVIPSEAETFVGAGTSPAPLTLYSGLSGPSNFGPGGRTDASFGSGDDVFLLSVVGTPIFGVPAGYSSGNFLEGSATYVDASYASLGLTRGTYVYTWGTGAHADTLTINVGSISSVSGGAGAVPEASTWVMMLAGFTGLCALALRKKKTTLA
jgi:hypothetical protein